MKPFLYAAALAVAATAADAATTSYTFTAVFDFRSAGADDGIADNSIADIAEALGFVSGTVRITDTLVNDNTADNIATFGGASITFDQPELASYAGPDQYNQRDNFGTTDQISFGYSAGAPTDSFNIIFNKTGSPGSPATLFDSTNYTTLLDPIDPADFTFGQRQLFFIGTPGGAFERVNFDIKTWEAVAPIPLPAGLPLMGAGLLLLGALRRRR